jgi:death-on-curing protein
MRLRPMATRTQEGRFEYDAGTPDDLPRFLTVEDVLALHQDLLARFGGDPGLLNPGALASAVAQPAMTAFGQLLHPTLVDQAAAYLFHLTANHPFCDGNKRIGLFAALVFLQDNGATILGSSDDWYLLIMDVASGLARKTAVTQRMAALVSLP